VSVQIIHSSCGVAPFNHWSPLAWCGSFSRLSDHSALFTCYSVDAAPVLLHRVVLLHNAMLLHHAMLVLLMPISMCSGPAMDSIFTTAPSLQSLHASYMEATTTLVYIR
jgi:hypothetical protein